MRSALLALLGACVLAAPASARPDGELEPYLAHQESLVILTSPATGTLTDGYGPRWGRLHAGIDIGILSSLDVRAAAGGTVRKAGWMGGYSGYGQVVLVDIGNGFTTMYAHLSRIDVKPGQLIAAGELLGLAGCTGSCTGTHLHFELHERGRPVDPIPFIAR